MAEYWGNTLNLSKYRDVLNTIHIEKPQKGFELNDRRVFIDEVLGQLDYSRDDIYFDVSQKGKSPDIRLYGKGERRNKNSMSRFVIETKNFDSLDSDINNVDFGQLKKYVIRNAGRIKYIVSTDYKSLFLFNAEALLIERRIDLSTDAISTKEIEGFKKGLVRKFDLFNMSEEDEQKIAALSNKNLFEEYDFPNPEESAERFDISNKNVRENFIRSLYYIMDEIQIDISEKFLRKVKSFIDEADKISQEEDQKQSFSESFNSLLMSDEYGWIRNLFIWAIQMNYLPNFIGKPYLIKRIDVHKILKEKEPISKDYYYNAYLATCIYSIINKTLFIRILEDSARKGTVNPFIKGEKESRYLSNGILYEKYVGGNLKEYVRYVFQFTAQDLKFCSFILKRDIFDWIIEEIEDYTLVHFLRVFNEIYLNKLDQDILGDIYEHYLNEEKDEKQGKSYRRLLGQYYTPRPIVRFMWSLVRDVYKNEHEEDIYSDNKTPLLILDPFMGSGAFLNEAVLQMKSAVSGRNISNGEVFYFFKDRLENKKIEDSLVGFEINPLSCTIGDINVFFRLIKSFSSQSLKNVPIKELNLVRTNSFDLNVNSIEKTKYIQTSLLADDIKTAFGETKKVVDVKSNNYDIIIGNPPYGFISPNDEMRESLIPFAFPANNFNSVGKEIDYNFNVKGDGLIPRDERNRGRLRDMYAYAFGVADKLLKDGAIVCFITSNTYLSLPTYKFMRKYWLKNYSIMYIINFNKINEKSNSLFSPEAGIGTAVILMIKKKPEYEHHVKYLDMSDINSIKGKFDYFCNIKWKEPSKDKTDIQSFEIKELASLNFELILQSSFLENNDYELLKANEICKKIENNSVNLKHYGKFQLGIQTGNDAIFVNNDKSGLKSSITNYVSNEGFEYFVSDVFVSKCIEHQNLIRYGKNGNKLIYYDKQLEKLINDKYKGNSSIRLRDDEQIKKKVKLIIGAYDFFVDSDGTLLTQNCIDGKNLYYLSNENEDILYYICAILNSSTGRYYRKMTQLDNYGTFPIKLHENHITIYNRIVDLSKEMHLLVTDEQTLINNGDNYKSNFFRTSVENNIKIYRIDQQNEFFKLIFPTELITSFTIEDVKISDYDKNIIELNREGLKLECINSETANFILNKYLKGKYGQIPELDIVINLTLFDENKYRVLLNQISTYKEKILRTINELVFCIYFEFPENYTIQNIYADGRIAIIKNIITDE